MRKLSVKKVVAGLTIALGMMFTVPMATPPQEVHAETLPIGEGPELPFNKSITFENVEWNYYYHMDLKKSGYLQYHGIGENHVSLLEIRDEDGNVVCDKGGFYSDLPQGYKVYLRAGRYSVRVMIGTFLGRADGGTEAVFYWRDADETFPETFSKNNDTEDTPTVVKDLNGKNWTGVFSNGDDYDFYKFTMTSKGTLTLGLKNKTEDVNPNFVLYKNNGDVVTDNSLVEFNNDKCKIDLPKGTYKIRIGSSGNGYYNFSMKATYAPVYKWKNTAAGKKYVDQYGKCATGWKKINGKQYYFNNKGIMQTGWKTIKGKRYFFNKNGVMQKGWKAIDGKRYLFSKNGVMQKGWKQINGKWYFLNKKTGVMAKGKVKIGKKVYRFSKNGVCLNP